jgi:O-antigen/teichoic acid export membrane protein
MAQGIGAQSFAQAVRILIRVSEVPLLLSFWGAQLYGEWLMLAAIPAYLTIGNAGFSMVACRDITMRSGAGDHDGALSVYQSTWLLLTIFSLSILCVAIIVVTVIPISSFLGFSAMGNHETSLVFVLLVGYIVAALYGGLFEAGFWASGRYPLGMWLAALSQLLEFLGLVLAVVMGGGPVQAAVGYLSGRIIGMAIIWWGQRRVTPWLTFGCAKASITELRRLAAPSFAAMAFPIGNALNIQGIRLIVGFVLGPAAVAVFVPLRTLSSIVLQPAAMVYRVTEPELSMAFGSADHAGFELLSIKASRISLWLSMAACLGVAVATPWLFPLWTGGKVALHWPVLIILLMSTPLRSFWGTSLMVLLATNRHLRIGTFYAALYGIIPVAVGYIAAKSLGLTGGALAVMLGEVLLVPFAISESRKLTRLSLGRWLVQVLQPPIKEGLEFGKLMLR